MPRTIDVPTAQRLVRNRSEYRELGCSERELARREASGLLVRVHRSWVVDGVVWRDLWPAGKHLLRVVAADREMVGGALVMSHESAAVLWDLPLFRHPYERVHATALHGVRANSADRVIRHTERLEEVDVAVVHGIRCTSLARTVFDLVRSTSLESAVSVADAALGRAAVSARIEDPDRAAVWRDEMRARIARSPGARGVKQARWVSSFADGRAELPGESVTRLHLHRLGFARPRLQVPVTGPDGTTFWIDLGLDDVSSWLEFDGQGKYLDEALRAGRTVEQVVLDEKRREDWVRGTTGRRFARVEGAHIRTTADMERRLAAFRIHPPR